MPTTKDTRACLLTKLEAGIEGVNFDTASAALQEYNLESLRLQATDIDLQIRSHAATIYDYFGQNEKASAMVEGLGEDCYHALKDLLRTTSEFRASPIFREMRRSYKLQVIAVLQRGYVYYRRSDYANYLKALDHWKLCLEALTTCIRSTDYPCHGSIGRVSYAIGLAYRQLGPPFYLEAKRFFSNAIDHAWLDVGRKRESWTERCFVGIPSRKMFSVGPGVGLVHRSQFDFGSTVNCSGAHLTRR